MLEAFERHLREHNISKQFEEAKTKEDKIEICKKFLESEGITVKPNLDPDEQWKEHAKSIHVPGGTHSITIDPSTFKGMGVVGAGGGGTILGGNIVASKQPKYFQVHYTLTENEELKFQNQTDVRLHIMNELMRELNAGLKKFVIQNNLIKSETDYSTLDKHYTIKVGFIE